MILSSKLLTRVGKARVLSSKPLTQVPKTRDFIKQTADVSSVIPSSEQTSDNQPEYGKRLLVNMFKLVILSVIGLLTLLNAGIVTAIEFV